MSAMASLKFLNVCRSSAREACQASCSRVPFRQLSFSAAARAHRWDSPHPIEGISVDETPLDVEAPAVELETSNRRGAQHRTAFVNLDTAREAVRAWGLDKKEDLTVIEAYPGESLFIYGLLSRSIGSFLFFFFLSGEGILTKAILELPNVSQILLYEFGDRRKDKLAKVMRPHIHSNWSLFFSAKINCGKQTFEHDKRVLIDQRSDPYAFHCYENLPPQVESKIAKGVPWEKGLPFRLIPSLSRLLRLPALTTIPCCFAEHPNLFFVSQLPDNMACEKLVFGSFGMGFRKMWLYRYGRVPAGMLVSKNLSTVSRWFLSALTTKR
jgi:hypothetical protein